MDKSLKYTKETLNSIKLLQKKHEYFKKEFVRLIGQKSYEQVQNYYQEVITKLTEEIEQLPIGYRYTGVFYLKVPYVVPLQFEKIEGSAFMREDLVSWVIEPSDPTQKSKYFGYHRILYKEPDLKTELTKADTTPVYS
jgi:hypothetical protein